MKPTKAILVTDDQLDIIDWALRRAARQLKDDEDAYGPIARWIYSPDEIIQASAVIADLDVTAPHQ